jgi:hypothetical protein
VTVVVENSPTATPHLGYGLLSTVEGFRSWKFSGLNEKLMTKRLHAFSSPWIASSSSHDDLFRRLMWSRKMELLDEFLIAMLVFESWQM